MDKEQESSYNQININWYPGHMAKTRRQIQEDLNIIDIIVEIVDARIPLSSQNPDVKEYSRKVKRIIVLNKADVADERETDKWVKFYKEKGIKAIPVEATTGRGMSNVTSAITEVYSEISQKYIEKGRTGHKIRVMILGIPNVGKSTFINKFSGKASTIVGNRPGLTRKKQWIQVNDKIEIMDTPGMLWPKLNDQEVTLHLAFMNSIGSAAVDKVEVAYYLLKYLIENYQENLEKRYDIQINDIISQEAQEDDYYGYEQTDSTMQVLEAIARKRGAILSGGRINEQKVADIILGELQTGKIGRITMEKVK